MMILRRILSVWVLFSFLGTSIILPPAQAQSVSADPSGLPFRLPKPGIRVNLSPAFNPVLIKGLKVHPENPFMFDFIVDPGDQKLNADDFKKTSQRMVNYFLASLTIPEKDLWVNLSPVEKDHIIPDALIKTELGRDLLAEDYMLKQVGSSLIYPDSNFGKTFWAKVYGEAYRKFGVTEVPVNVFNKIWILPEKASVFEKGNAVYIVNAHLKVMMEEDYLVQNKLGKKMNQGRNNVPVKDISKKVMREVVVPAIEKEVNEDKNFAQLRQVFYALILAQWYQDVFKESILNKIYSGHTKIAGINVSDPKNKDLIYQQYLSAYKKGVFNYIKEETDRVTQQPVSRKYFSGGFVGQKVQRERASYEDLAMASDTRSDVNVAVELKPNMLIESLKGWNDPDRALDLLKELRENFKEGKLNLSGLYSFIDKYVPQVSSQSLYPVQGAWPVLKAITLLRKSEEQALVNALKKSYLNKDRPELVDKILLMNNIIDREQWLKERAPNLVGRRVYLLAAEIHHWAGGLGPVMKFHGKGMKDLGADIAYIEPWYQLRRDKGNPNGDLLDYKDPDMGIRELNDNFDEFDVEVGDINGIDVKKVHVKVATGIDENGIRVYMLRDVQANGNSYYTKMLYNYEGRNNPVRKEESVAFLNVASAKLLYRLEQRRKEDLRGSWRPAVVHANDGQFAPLKAVTLSSEYGTSQELKDIFWAFTTHTYGNRWTNTESTNADIRTIPGAIKISLIHMMRIHNTFINAFRQIGYIDYSSGGIRLANWTGAVSNKHRDDVAGKDPNVNMVAVTNGAVPEEMAGIFRDEFNKLQKQGKISETADIERPTAQEVALVKRASKMRFNDTDIKDFNGRNVVIDLKKPMIGYARRLVDEKAGRERAFSNKSIWMMVHLGYNVVLMGNHQGTKESEELAKGLRKLAEDISNAKEQNFENFPGSFQFVESFTPHQKKLFLAAADVQIQDSDNHTGAAEFSEEDITANAGYQGGASFREGVIIDQGIPVDFEHPGRGQTLMPREDTDTSWIDTVYTPLMELWKKKNHDEFYQNAALSPRLNRIQRYLITSAAYLREYNRLIGRQEEYAWVDRETQVKIVNALKGDQGVIKGILYEGRNGVTEFKFNILDQGEFKANNKGLDGLVSKRKFLEDLHGYDIFFGHYFNKDPNNGFNNDFENYLKYLFGGTGLAAELLEDWKNGMERDIEASRQEKAIRLGKFMENIAVEFEKVLQHHTDLAKVVTPGGIKLENIPLERHGRLMTNVFTDKALEDTLLKAQGLYGVIVGITPIPNLLDFIR